MKFSFFISSHDFFFNFNLAKAKWRLFCNQRVKTFFWKVKLNRLISAKVLLIKVQPLRLDTFRKVDPKVHSCATSKFKERMCVECWESRGSDEVKAKLNHLAVDCKLCFAWFMSFHVIQSVHTFHDTCFASFLPSSCPKCPIAYSFQCQISFSFIVNGKIPLECKKRKNETKTVD